MIARVTYHVNMDGRDDATVVVVKEK